MVERSVLGQASLLNTREHHTRLVDCVQRPRPSRVAQHVDVTYCPSCCQGCTSFKVVTSFTTW